MRTLLLAALGAIALPAQAGWSGPDLGTVSEIHVTSTGIKIVLTPATGTTIPNHCPSGDPFLTVLTTDAQYGAFLVAATLAKDLKAKVQTYGENAAGTSCRPVQFVLQRATP